MKRTYYFRRGELDFGGTDNFDSVLAKKGQRYADEYRAGWNAKEASQKALHELILIAFPNWYEKKPDATTTPGP